MKNKKLLAFGWYGGKFSHLKWLLPLLPQGRHYCEPFAGSASVLLNRDPSPIETYNDIDGEVVNFFRVLREQTEDLISIIRLTPYSREEFTNSIRGDRTTISSVERARRFYIRVRQSRLALAQTATPGRWNFCVNKNISVPRWKGGIEGLEKVADRILKVQIENRPSIEVIKRYDSPDTVFYCDPPYLHETRRSPKAYGFEMTDQDHEELSAVLLGAKGKVALSGYRCPKMETWYKEWRRFDPPPKYSSASHNMRKESLWMNYDEKEYPQSMFY